MIVKLLKQHVMFINSSPIKFDNLLTEFINNKKW